MALLSMTRPDPCPGDPSSPGDAEDGIEELRRRIDEIDARLLETLASRRDAVLRIGAHKRRLGIAALQPERHRQVLLTREAHGARLGLAPAFVRELFERIHAEAVGDQLSLFTFGQEDRPREP
jgi:chorismate mutase